MGSFFLPERANEVKDIMSKGKWTALIMGTSSTCESPLFLGEKIFINAKKYKYFSK
jgi:hypothetical protein